MLFMQTIALLANACAIDLYVQSSFLKSGLTRLYPTRK